MSRIQKDANYTRKWLAVRKTRLKKTGMTAFFEMFDKLYREYDAEKFIRDVSGGSNWENDEGRMRRGFTENNEKFLALFRAHERDWSSDEARYLKDFGRALKWEIEYWEKRPIKREVEARKRDEREARERQLDGDPDRALTLAVDEAASLTAALRQAADVSESEGKKARAALGETHEAAVYERFVMAYKQANDRLMTAIEAADKGAVKLAARMSKVPRPDSEARGVHDLLKRLLGASTSKLSESQEQVSDWQAAVRRFESSWTQLKSEVIDRQTGLEAQVEQARKELDSMASARGTMGFVRGDHYDSAAIRRFQQLETELPKTARRVESAASDLALFERAVERAFAGGWGCVLGADSPAVNKARSALPVLRSAVQSLTSDSAELRRFVDDWKSRVRTRA